MSSRNDELATEQEQESARDDFSDSFKTSTHGQVESPTSNSDAQREKGKENHPSPFICLAALRGDWKDAETALRLDENAGRLKITKEGDRPLHIAAAAKQTAFVYKLVEWLKEEDLELPNNNGYTAFCFAAMSGVVEIAKVMYEKNKNLPTIPGRSGTSPIEVAALMGNKKMVEYLYKITPLQDFEAEERMNILVATIKSDMYDIALNILKADRSVVTSPDVQNKGSALYALAQKPLPNYGTSQEWLCERLDRIFPYVPCFKRIYGSIQMRRQARQLVKELWEQILTLDDSEISNIIKEPGTPILTDAAKIGNVEFLTLLTHSYPNLIFEVDSNEHSIFHVAVIYRQEKVFNLIYDTRAFKDLLMLFKDKDKKNILQLAAKLPPPSRLNIVSGAALQMQRELLWFKEVEKNLKPFNVRMNSNDTGNKTPRELFTETHEKLQKDGEDWMKDTANSCMVVATLIATVAFAAALTVPGGNQEETGTPIFLNNRWFTVFAISDAVAMFSSTASVLMFLSILTSRYGEDDFLFTLPAKLMVGLITLFASIVCMVLTFSATFFLVYKEEQEGTLPKIVAGVALLPITLYAMLNCRLWKSIILSTICTRFMFRPGKHRLF